MHRQGYAQFRDRTDAGRQLAARLATIAFIDPVVLALPRGGVPVADELAARLGAPLDLVMVRKIGAPTNSEYAIGAVIDGHPPQRVLDAAAIRYTRASEDYIEAETRRQLDVIARRRELYLAGRAPLRVTGRDVIVVDDGIATGSTIRAALRGLRRMQPASITLAFPVAPVDVATDLGPEVDRLVCLSTPDKFGSVGEFYADFSQTTDEEVLALLARARHRETRSD